MQESSDDVIDVALEKVVDEATFVEFLMVLAADREEAAAKERKQPSSPWGIEHGGWENRAIEAFLEAAAAWAKDSDGAPKLPPKATNPWRRCADILAAGKTYE